MKKNILRIGILTSILLIGIALYICIGINVMDRICWFGLYGGLNHVPESEGIGLSRDISANFILETLGAAGVDYKEEYLKDSVGVSLCFYKGG